MTEQAKVPAIRFAGFTDPWEQRKLEDIANRVTRKNEGESDLPLTISSQYGLVDQRTFFNNQVASKDMSGYYLLRKGEFAYNKSTSGDSPWGAVKRLVRYEKGCVSTLYICFGLDGADPDFLVTYYETDRWYKAVQMIAAEGARNHGLLNIAPNDFFDTALILPPSREEQELIGLFFARLDNLITLHQRKYDKLVILKKSMLEKMFPKDGESVPEIRFAGFTDPWEQRKFSEIVDVCSGRDYKHLDEGPIPVYGTGGYMTSVSEALSHNRDAIGIGRKGTIDKPYLLKAPFWTVDTLFYAIPKSDINLEFALCSFLNVDWKSKDESTGLPSLSKESINETVLSVPNVVEQNHLGNFFADLDRLITLHQRKLELLQNIKKSLLDKMFV
ncbi:restriction endonuclease subunit S [Bifidobacterium longum]|uniref:restriction endonuclease subunit S n=1 Tax=Bifidobacterium longum TaxID=216816 RepID=UPI001914910C|nr:restriction endonuclease subunit S [Bifidobacterium longum subsp. longum]MBL3905584.1 restriction endonuclease subunit S [Bifidobacterium longum subsp. longum]MBL3911294.1 restriction endonuclease subunit S [Bifidobacterium longum subsp. longum]